MLKSFRVYPEQDKKLVDSIKQIVGSPPLNLELYRLATKHISVAKKNMFGLKESNERLEYLGDAVLSTVVAEYLFKKYPYKDEGFLTDIRSRIVNRESLNTVAKKIGVSNIIVYDQSHILGNGKGKLSHKSIDGDTLEALVGAVYLDKGFSNCKKFILKRLLLPHFDLDSIINTNPNYKSTVIEWAQKTNREIRFEIIDTKGDTQFKEFIAQIFIDGVPICTGSGYSKKKAEQNASQKALEILDTDTEED
ncbi:ribonuclease III [Catalinimonas niigatensis]|uniref:ribonuclease III n=1 Tax=Catalinimonas niigatensis TaxID=1397264 RepID=UPI00266579F2|nr:ribonuclease III [Catalinimonas niigatensis]WPP50217.1 ribonuclease III [Catalinimonas niigatensis]